MNFIQQLAALMTVTSGLAWLIMTTIKMRRMYEEREDEIKAKAKEKIVEVQKKAEEIKETVEKKVEQQISPKSNDGPET